MLTVLYVATKNTPGMVNYEKSLEKFGYPHERLGKGDKWGGWRYRMQVYEKACSARNPEDILILTDADDVICVKDPDGVVDKFRAFGTPVVVGAESLCVVGYCVPLSKYWDIKGPKNSSYVYANCGCIMGQAGDLAHMWKWMYDQGYEDDQVALCHYINQFPDRVSVDSLSTLFYNPGAEQKPNFQFEQGHLVSVQDPLDHNILYPYFVHFPGGFVRPALKKLLFMDNRPHPYDALTKEIVPDGQALEYQHFNKDSTLINMILFWLFVALTVVFCVLMVVFILLWQQKRSMPLEQSKTPKDEYNHPK